MLKRYTVPTNKRITVMKMGIVLITTVALFFTFGCNYDSGKANKTNTHGEQK